MKVVICIGLLVSLVTCKTEKLDIDLGFDSTSIYKFSIDAPAGTGAPSVQYLIKGYSLIINEESDTEPVFFLLKGMDSATNAEIIISFRYSPHIYDESDLNINIDNKKETKFYKNCNDFSTSLEKGNDTKGRFVKIIIKPNSYITKKLVGERDMNPECILSNFDPIIYYYH